MRHERGTSLLELLMWMGIFSVGLSSALGMVTAERLSRGEQTKAFRASAAASGVLFEIAKDLRRTTRVAPRQEGPGALLFSADGRVVAWFARAGADGEIHRRVLFGDGEWGPDAVVARGVEGLVITEEDGFFVVRIGAGSGVREIVVGSRADD